MYFCTIKIRLKIFKKLAFYFLLTLVVLILSFGGSLLLFKDSIFKRFIDEVNKSLGTPVQIGRIDVYAWNDFSNLSITFTDVYVEYRHLVIYQLLMCKTIPF